MFDGACTLVKVIISSSLYACTVGADESISRETTRTRFEINVPSEEKNKITCQHHHRRRRRRRRQQKQEEYKKKQKITIDEPVTSGYALLRRRRRGSRISDVKIIGPALGREQLQQPRRGPARARWKGRPRICRGLSSGPIVVPRPWTRDDVFTVRPSPETSSS